MTGTRMYQDDGKTKSLSNWNQIKAKAGLVKTRSEERV